MSDVSTTAGSGEGTAQSGSEAVFNLSEVYGNEEGHEPKPEEHDDPELLKAFEEAEEESEPEEEEEEEAEKKERKKENKKKTVVEEDEDTDTAEKENVPTYIDIPDEVVAEALYDAGTLKNVINTSFHQYESRVQNAIMETAQRVIGAVEVMMHLHEYSKQYPEISKYPNVMQKLIAKHVASGDPATIVQNAVNEYLSAYRRYSSMPKGPGRVIDVRENKTPPKKSGASVQNAGTSVEGDDPNNIGYLAAVLNRAIKR